MLGCEVLWDAQGAKRMQELVQEATGGPCPCTQGKACPVLPRTLAVVAAVPLVGAAMAAAQAAADALQGLAG